MQESTQRPNHHRSPAGRPGRLREVKDGEAPCAQARQTSGTRFGCHGRSRPGLSAGRCWIEEQRPFDPSTLRQAQDRPSSGQARLRTGQAQDRPGSGQAKLMAKRTKNFKLHWAGSIVALVALRAVWRRGFQFLRISWIFPSILCG